MRDMIGRYEFVGGSSSKFWQIKQYADGYLAEWGRIGSGPQGERYYTEAEAYKKIREKIGKGYQKVGTMRVNKTELEKQMGSSVKKTKTEKVEKKKVNFLEELRKIK
jgi:predicted DNA-binding WGR domain protein